MRGIGEKPPLPDNRILGSVEERVERVGEFLQLVLRAAEVDAAGQIGCPLAELPGAAGDSRHGRQQPARNEPADDERDHRKSPEAGKSGRPEAIEGLLVDVALEPLLALDVPCQSTKLKWGHPGLLRLDQLLDDRVAVTAGRVVHLGGGNDDDASEEQRRRDEEQRAIPEGQPEANGGAVPGSTSR